MLWQATFPNGPRFRGIARACPMITRENINEGLVLQRILTPELCPDEVFYEAFAAFAAERGQP